MHRDGPSTLRIRRTNLNVGVLPEPHQPTVCVPSRCVLGEEAGAWSGSRQFPLPPTSIWAPPQHVGKSRGVARFARREGVFEGTESCSWWAASFRTATLAGHLLCGTWIHR